MKALSMVKNVFELVFASFFQLSYLTKTSDTSINKNVIYANVIDANPLQKRFADQ